MFAEPDRFEDDHLLVVETQGQGAGPYAQAWKHGRRGHGHSDLEQVQREEVMLNFKNNKVKILVATDIVARGIDIEDIGLIVNYDVPHDPEDYIHRIGRTAVRRPRAAPSPLSTRRSRASSTRSRSCIERDIRKAELPESVGEGPKYAPDENRGRFGRRRPGRRASRSQWVRARRTERPFGPQRPESSQRTPGSNSRTCRRTARFARQRPRFGTR